MHRIAAALAFGSVLWGCGNDHAAPRSALDIPSARAEQRTSVSATASAVAVSDRDSGVPSWGPIALRKAAAPKPVPYTPDPDKPTLVVFFASWCDGCTAGILHEAHMAQKLAGKVRIGFALGETDAAFDEYARNAKIAIDLPVWTENAAVKDLKQRCEVGTIPAACIVGKDGKVAVTSFGPGDALAVLEMHAGGRSDQVEASYASIADLVAKAAAAPGDADLRARALRAASGFAHLENSLGWDLVADDKSLELAAGLAKDATVATGGLNFAILDTYAFALWKLGKREDAARVAARAVEVCDAVGASCGDERKRYEEFKTASTSK